jgi:two-component system, LytTR family, sensor kinase
MHAEAVARTAGTVATHGVRADAAPAAPPTAEQRVAVAIVLFSLGALVGALLASMPVRMRTATGGSPWASVLTTVGIGSLTMLACGVSAPLFIRLARRFPMTDGGWRVAVPVQLTVIILVAAITSVLHHLLVMQFLFGARGASITRGLWVVTVTRTATTLVPFLALVVGIYALELYRQARTRELESAHLRAQLAETRLEMLSTQLRPHFLFNTLQGVSTLMHRDVAAADAMLGRLSDLLRESLSRDGRPEVTLAEELEVLDQYVGIARERFGERLQFTVQVSPEALDAMVPFFVLQPLVENALEHGVARRAGRGHVTVSAERMEEWLEIAVADDGPGIVGPPQERIGLRNTRERLRQLHGDRQSLTLQTMPEAGMRVVVRLPYVPGVQPDRAAR